MALADKIDDAPVHIHGLPCSVGALLARLDGAELEALEAMLYKLGWSARRIYDAVTAEGHDIGLQTVNRHRSRGCRCFKAVS